MKTQHQLALTLKSLMAEKPLDEISVLLLTKKCKINRQTFYYYFHDIYDLLTQVFLDEKIDEFNTANDFQDVIKGVFDYYSNNKPFIDAVLSSGGKDLFQEFLYNIFYSSTLRFINKIEESKKLTPNSKKEIARFYASGFSFSTVYYLSTYVHKTYLGLKNSFCFITNEQLKKTITNFVKAKENK